MNKEDIKNFLAKLGVAREEMKEERGYINSPCPQFFAHSEGKDKKPSFGIKIDDEGNSYYYCFGCSPNPHSLIRLLHNMWLMLGEYPYEAAKILAREQQIIMTDEEIEDPWKIEKKKTSPLSYDVTNQFLLLQFENGYAAKRCKEFLKSRGIPIWVQNYCRVRFDPHFLTLIFPLTGVDKRIYLLRARSIREKKMWTISPKLAEAPGPFPKLKDVGVFFGTDRVSMEAPIILVEGAIDAMRIVSLGYFNVIASATSSITLAQINAISSEVLILGFDNDNAGLAGIKKICKELKNKMILFRADWGLVGCKDPGELKSREDLEKVLDHLAVNFFLTKRNLLL